MSTIPRLRVFADESGDFGSCGTHVVCAVVFADGCRFEHEVAAIWRELGIDWEDFHSKDDRDHRPVVRNVEHFRARLQAFEVAICFAWHVSDERYQHTYYIPMVARALETAWEVAAPRVVAAQPIRPRTIQCATKLEHRSVLNLASLRDRLHAQCKLRGDTSIGSSFELYTVEKGSDPIVQVADLFSNAYYRYKQWGVAALAPALQDLPAKQCHRAWLQDPTQVELERVVIGTARPPEIIAPAIEATSRAEVLILRARELRGASIVERCSGVLADLAREPACQQRAQLELLFETAERCLDVEHDHQVGGALVELAATLVARARPSSEWPAALLDAWVTRAVSLQLLVANHAGRSISEATHVQDAIAAAARLASDPANWEMTAKLHAFIGVNLHNAMRFADAERMLAPHVDYFVDRLKGPDGQALRTTWIGRLMGTHAQTLAFTAHDRYFCNGGSTLAADLELARMYSELTKEYFPDGDDRVRHDTYRAHMYLMEYALGKQASCLAAARALLGDEPACEDAVATFLETFPAHDAVTQAYRIVAILKLCWLERSRPPWIERLAAGVLDQLPTAIHPYEQLVGYLAMLSRERGRLRLADHLRAAGWTHIVALIARCFEAQLDHAETGKVRAEVIERIIAASEVLPKSFLAGRFHKELAHYERLEGGRSPGPLILLPFNYC